MKVEQYEPVQGELLEDSYVEPWATQTIAHEDIIKAVARSRAVDDETSGERLRDDGSSRLSHDSNVVVLENRTIIQRSTGTKEVIDRTRIVRSSLPSELHSFLLLSTRHSPAFLCASFVGNKLGFRPNW